MTRAALEREVRRLRRQLASASRQHRELTVVNNALALGITARDRRITRGELSLATGLPAQTLSRVLGRAALRRSDPSKTRAPFESWLIATGSCPTCTRSLDFSELVRAISDRTLPATRAPKRKRNLERTST